jgi:mannose-6-phosphate isomerase-like protein (cupin superfamily)
MVIRNHNTEPGAQTPHGIKAAKMYDRDHGVIMHLTLAPGEALKPHETPVDVVFYVVEGTPTILIGEERQQVSQDDLVESPKDIVHCIYNETAGPVRVLVMKLPRPEAPTRMVGKQ